MHIMIDIETLGPRPGSVIAAIGAVAFDPVVGTLDDDGLMVHVNLADAQRLGLRVDADTVGWWLNQSAAARAGTFSVPVIARESLLDSLDRLTSFWRGKGASFAWSNGAGFDLVLLESAYFACNTRSPPWKYWAARDTRTIYDLAGINPKDYFDPSATAHNPLDDARAQAKAVIAAYAKLGLAVKAPEVVA